MAEPRPQNWRRFVFPEPAFLLYAFGAFMSFTILEQYSFYRVSQMYGLSADSLLEEGTGGCKNSVNESAINSTLLELENQVQAHTSMMNLGISLLNLVPSILTSVLIGAYTDTHGRRTGLLLPLIGGTLQCVIILLVMYFNLPVYVLFAASFANGCGGSVPTIALSGLSYLADITNESNRTFRIATLEFMTFMAGVISLLTTGLWIESFGFFAPYWFIVGCYLVSAFYIAALLPESRPKLEGSPGFFSGHSFKAIYSLLTKSRSGSYRRRNLLLMVAASGLIYFSVLGLQGSYTLYFIGRPFCFSSSLIGYFWSCATFLYGIGAVVGVATLRQCLSDINVSRFGLLGAILSPIYLIFCDSQWMIFLENESRHMHPRQPDLKLFLYSPPEPVIRMIGGTVDPVLKGMMSKTVGSDEQGTLFSAVVTVETLSQVLGAFLFSSLYATFVRMNLTAAVFVIGSAASLVPVILISLVKTLVPLNTELEKEEIVPMQPADKSEKNLEITSAL